ncbi:transcription factor 25-like [Uloborus diversus]|uniref:transcription factor 25-like n=1 Tax=Uloborus diversus TaxID=327109 RepID=UPI00240930F9|nr:transcription factor 25-like [Uloborus diversus]
MSSRVLKKLHGEKDLATVLGMDGMSESDDGGASFRGAVEKPVNNRFELLNNVDHSLSDTETKEDDDRENEPSQDGQERKKLEKQDSTHSTDSLKRRKKKKKKKLKNQKSTEENLDDGEDEIEASIRDVSKMLGEPEPNMSDMATRSQAHSEKPAQEKSIFYVELRNLNPDNEMRKLFGSKVVQNEQVKKRGRGRTHGRSSVLVSPKNWPHAGKSGLSMRMLENKDDVCSFTFEHSKQYQAVQVQFLEAVESFNPDNIVALLNLYPHHIDALIQFSDICKMGDDTQMAAELIERALYYMECALHPLFNVCVGNCRLDYRRVENRSFFIALFKHIMYVGQRGCNRTALEFCKFLLSLDPEEDPLCAILMIDYYALRSQQHDYLIRLFQEWDMTRNLSQLPNFAFSIPLAMFLKALDEGQSSETADLMLQNALIMFPGFLLPILNKCNVEPDKVVSTHPFFQRIRDSPPLTSLLNLYAARTHSIWRSREIMLWLERQVNIVLERHSREEAFFSECEKKRKIRYPSTPRNVLRHVILSDVRDANFVMPQDISSSPIFAFDPLPPPDSITPYRRSSRAEVPDDQGVLSMFFSSLLPTFNVPHDGAAHAHGGAERAARNDLRRSVTSLIDAMRDLISSEHNADDIPDEADVDSDEDTRET